MYGQRKEDKYLDPGGVGVGAVIEADGVAHLVSQQGASLLRYTVGYLSAGPRGETAEYEAGCRALNFMHLRPRVCKSLFLLANRNNSKHKA